MGFIPEEIKWLYSLESLDIQNNHLVSNLCVGGRSDQVPLTQFQAGTIPSALGELEGLSYLSLDGNRFSGVIPDVFENLSNLGK